MKHLIEQEFQGLRNLRDQLLDVITDDDLAYRLPGNNLTLGELCVEMGQTQQIYTQSFKTFEQDWGYRGTEPNAPDSVASLWAWYADLDADLIKTVGGLSEDDIANKQIDRGHGFMLAPEAHLQVYREALLIFYAKASLYLRALEKERTNQWKSWIG